MKERITFEEWYKFNVVDNEIIDKDTKFYVKIFTSEKMHKDDMVMAALNPACIVFKLFANLPVISIFPMQENYNSSMCACLYLDCNDHKDETAYELFEDNE